MKTLDVIDDPATDVRAKKGVNATKRAPPAGVHVSWYPVALSREVEPGKVLAKDVFGTRVILYRDLTGKPIVQSAYCPHLGTDLSEGDVIDGQIRCPFHHWRFDAKGACSHIPTGDKIPPGARLSSYPTGEAWDLIWAFNAPTPLFELPTMPESAESELVYETVLRDILPIEPWMIRANTLDFQHFRSLHGFTATEPEKLEIEPFKLEFWLKLDAIGFEQHARITGTNTFSQRFHYGAHSKFFDFGKVFAGEDVFFLFTGTPLNDGCCTFFATVAVRKPRDDSPEAQETTRMKLQKLREFANFLYEADRRVFMSIRFRQGTLSASDRCLAQFFRYVNEYPRVMPPET